MSRKPNKDPCKKNACMIQSCLDNNKYQESACLDVLELMRQCCLQHHEISLCCSGIKLDKPYLPVAEDSAINSKKSNGKS